MSQKDSQKDMLNVEAIADRRISVEDANIVQTQKPGLWLCHYCAKRFTNEIIFERHTCKEKVRAKELASPMGQAAYQHYLTWMRVRKFKMQSIDAFAASRYYKQFLKFAEMVASAGISKPDRYIEIMLEAGITPDLWCREQCYTMYLDYMDTREKPIDQVIDSIQCLMDIADREGVAYGTIISHLGPQRVLSLITQRKVSPWFLFHSTTSQELIRSLSVEEKKAYDKIIKFSAWATRLQQHAAIREEIRSIVKEVGL